MNDIERVFEQLQPMKASELRAVIKEAKRLLARKPLYIREINKVTPHGRYVYMVATWNEDGKTLQKSLGRKRAQVDEQGPDKEGNVDESAAIISEFASRGIYAEDSITFLRTMLANGFYLAN